MDSSLFLKKRSIAKLTRKHKFYKLILENRLLNKNDTEIVYESKFFFIYGPSLKALW